MLFRNACACGTLVVAIYVLFTLGVFAATGRVYCDSELACSRVLACPKGYFFDAHVILRKKMITVVLLTAEKKAGNLSRIVLSARRLGFRLTKQSMQKSDDPNFDKIRIEIESDFPIHVDSLGGFRNLVPTIVTIETVNEAVDTMAVKVEPQAPPVPKARPNPKSQSQPKKRKSTSKDPAKVLSSFQKQVGSPALNFERFINQLDD